MRKLKSFIAMAAFSAMAALLPFSSAFADPHPEPKPPVESLIKPSEVILGVKKPSDQVPSKVEVTFKADKSIADLIKGKYNDEWLEANDLYDMNIVAQVDFAINDKTKWLAYSESWDKCKKGDPDSCYEICNSDIYVDETTNEANYTTTLFDWMEGGEEYKNEHGYNKVVDSSLVKYTRFGEYKFGKFDEYEVPYIDWNVNTLYVRARIVLAYKNNSEDEWSYIYSDWTESAPYGNFKADDKAGNLLVNGDFEEGMTGWYDPDKCWDAVQMAECHEGRHGRYLTWPVYANNGSKEVETGSSVSLYQDVSLAGYRAGQTAVFNCLICNYDQGLGDMGTASLIFLDKDGNKISASNFVYRNPNWIGRSIIAAIPEGAVSARVQLTATLYAGNDVDVYIDYASLVITDDVVFPVTVTEQNNKWQVKSGDVLQLTANNGVSTNPADFTWYSSCATFASVDENGVVTMRDDAATGVLIYATDKKTGVAGVYMINIEDPDRSLVGTTVETEDGAEVTVLTDGNDGNTVEYAPAATSGKVVIPDEVTVNGVPYKVTEIKKGAFKKSSITEITIGKNITSIGSDAFNGCTKLTKVKLGTDVTEIGSGAFSGCSKLTSITLPKGLLKIGDKAFLNCKALKTITITDKVVSIGKQAFKGCTSLTTVKIGKKVTDIGKEAFSGCTKLNKVTIGASVKTIGDKAFYGCKALKSVTIPAKVTKIGKSAFEKCSALKTVTIKTKAVTFGSKCFKSINSQAKVTAPKKLKNAAKLIKKAGVSGKSQTIKVK